MALNLSRYNMPKNTSKNRKRKLRNQKRHRMNLMLSALQKTTVSKKDEIASTPTLWNQLRDTVITLLSTEYWSNYIQPSRLPYEHHCCLNPIVAEEIENQHLGVFLPIDYLTDSCPYPGCSNTGFPRCL